MLFGYLTLFTALIISLSAAVYSILGLTAIFAAAFWPIVILGGSLEFGKIITTLWLHKYWDRAELQYKLYLCSAVAILMLLTSMGVFGFLSKAHSDQSLVSGDVGAKIAIYDEKIKISRENIDANRRALKQMDEAVDQVMGRSSDEKGADKAVAIRRGQNAERQRLLKEIDAEQKKITALNEERAPIAAEVRKVDAEVGPIKYIAALIYGDNPDANVLEHAVRWVIILIVVVFDPLALTLLLAATKTLEWEQGINIFEPQRRDEESEEADQILHKGMANSNPDDNVPLADSLEPVFDREEIPLEEPMVEEPKKRWAGFGFPMSSIFDKKEDPPAEETIEELVIDDTPPEQPDPFAHIVVPEIDRNEDPLHHMAKVMWHAANPDDDHRLHHALHQAGEIDRLPWHTADHINSLAISDGEKKQLIERFANTPPPPKPTPQPLSTPPSGDGNLWVPQDGGWVNAGPITDFDFGDLGLEADNVPAQSGEVKGFGTQFPASASKGDMFLRVDQLPSALYKFNGNRWIEVDKSLTDSHAYDAAYIDHLISKIESGEYDPDLLSDAERDSIERRLNNTSRGV